MAHVVRCLAAVLLACALSACDEATSAPAGEAQASVARVVTPVAVAVRGAVESVVAPESDSDQRSARSDVPVDMGNDGRDGVGGDARQRLATALIVRWEVTSPAAYARKYQGVIWPGGASGPTWGIGYDGGHQTPWRIHDDWAAHPSVRHLESTSGVVGHEAQRRIAEWVEVRTPFALAERVFTDSTLPSYTAAARRALGPAFDDLDEGDHAALVSLGYNRGWSTTGPRRSEIRVIRDQCVPARDSECVARQLESMCRLWPDTPGLCNRRKDEARTARTH